MLTELLTPTQCRPLASQNIHTHRAIIIHPPTQSRSLTSQGQSCSQSYSTHTYTMKVFGLLKTVTLTELLTPTRCRFLASQRQSCSQSCSYTNLHKAGFGLLKDMQSCSHGDTNLHKSGFGLSKRHAHRTVIHTTQCRYFLLLPFKDTHAHRETRKQSGSSVSESRAKRNHTATVGAWETTPHSMWQE